MIAAKAKENLSIAGASYSPKEGCQNSDKVTKPIDTRDELALQLEEMIREKAKDNLRISGEVYGKGLQNSAEPIKPIDTRAELASIAGVSHDTIHKVKAIEAKAPERIKQQARTFYRIL